MEAIVAGRDEHTPLLGPSAPPAQTYAQYTIDVEGIVQSWNPGVANVMGYEGKDILGKHFSMFFTEEDRRLGAPAHLLADAAREGHVEIEGWRLRRNGERFWAFCVLSALQEGGRLVGYVKVTNDISARRRVERERDRFFELSGDVLCVGRPDGCFERVNPAFERVTGYALAEVRGRPFVDFVHPNDVAASVAAFQRQLRGEAVVNFENRHRCKDGGFRWFQWTAASDDETNLVYASARDVTQQKRDEQRLLQSNRELETFASVASHDLQEPLRKIRAFGNLVKAEAEGLSADARDYIDRMNGAADRMSGLIDDLLAFSRVTSRTQPFAPVDLGTVAGEALSDLSVSVAEAGATVEIDPLPVVAADATQMRQLFQNLISNAIKFRRPGVAPRVHVRGRTDLPGDTVTVSVQDNGIGFDRKHADRIFEVFQRLHGRGTYPGSGIGLAICRRIVTRHGGAITADSEPGVGSTFSFQLPIAPRDEGAA